MTGPGAPTQVVVGLTGNIACGKSAVLRRLAERGAFTLDADAVYRDLVEPGMPLLGEIAARFGPGIIAGDGSLDRKALGAIVVGDKGALRDLDLIVRPWVATEMLRRAHASGRPVVILEAIKIVESGLVRHCDELWVVACETETQIARLMARNGWPREEALRWILAQPPQEEKIAVADRVIRNDGTLAELHEQVDRLLDDLLERRGLVLPAADTVTGG